MDGFVDKLIDKWLRLDLDRWMDTYGPIGDR